MANFLPVTLNDEGTIRGAARIMYAAVTQALPTQVADVVNLSTYVGASGWFDLGATKDGITITFNATGEEAIDVDQVYGDIDAFPNGWSMEVATSLAEVTLDRLAFAWEQITVATVAKIGGNEKQTNFGTPLFYTKRKMAVLFQKPSGKIRMFVFVKAQRMPQDSTLTFAKTGPQQTIPMRFRCMPDLSIAEATARFAFVTDQV
jgi:hypothetical protein